MSKKIRMPIITVAGHVDHGKCVSGDTLIPIVGGAIKTAKEIFDNHYKKDKAKKISDGIVQKINNKGLLLNTFDGKNIINGDVSHIWKRKADKLIEIRTASGDTIKATPEHPFFVFNISGLIEKRADTVIDGEYIAVPKMIGLQNKDPREHIISKLKELNNFICFVNEDSEIVNKLKKSNKSAIEKKLGVRHLIDNAGKKRFKVKDYFKLCEFFKIPELEAYNMIKFIKNTSEMRRAGHTSNMMQLPKEDGLEKMGYVLGCIAGDGSISNKRIVLHNNDTDIQESYRRYLKGIFGLETKINQNRTCQDIMNNGGLTFGRFIVEVLGFPEKNKSANICVPEIAKENKDIFKGFFSGLFDTDGYVSHMNHSIEITSKSKTLIKECAILLLGYEIHSTIFQKNGFHYLRVSNKIYLDRFLENFNPRLKRKLKRVIDASQKAQTSRIFDFLPLNGDMLKELNVSGNINKKIPYFTKYMKSNRLSAPFLKSVLDNLKQENETSEKMKNILEKDISFVEIVSKKEIKNGERYVYDFTVPVTNNFVAERILVHNTSILDSIRGTVVQEGESGGITQKISFTKVPMEKIDEICPIIKDNKIKLDFPGFLFIDTPGHAAFSHLRKRGGSLADLAILVMDINDGIKPQTIEVIEILKLNKIPFVIALNKIDNISGWRKLSDNVKEDIDLQSTNTKSQFNEKLLTIIGSLQHHGFQSELFYNVKDFTKEIAIVPCSAKTNEGISELIFSISGLSQKFLKDQLILGSDAKGVLLEIKKEKSMGYVEAILYDGNLNSNDEIAIASFDNPIVSKIRVMEEIQPISNKFKSANEVSAATGVRLQLINSKEVLPGMPFTLFKDNMNEIEEEFKKEIGEKTKTDDKGIIVKADSLGSLEALLTLIRKERIQIISAGIGKISKKDAISAKANLENDKINALIVGFNTEIDEDVEVPNGVKVLTNDVIYKLIEDVVEFQKEKTNEIQKERLMSLATITKLKVLPQFVFRNSNPSVFGVSIVAGKLRNGIPLIDGDGKQVARVKDIQEDRKSVESAEEGKEIAISLPGVNFERQLAETDYLYSDISEKQFKKFKDNKDILTQSEIQTLQKVAEIKRKKDVGWGV